ncbi:hypothetical protein [Nocardia sp. NPDC019302]|uniref:hypothetical protein n=1 Tax=Nocardia sp. NPDC019302 TaxID=3154592 RepID=UPI0033D5DD64
MPLSENQAKLLGALFAESERRCSVRELGAMADVPERTARREISGLERSGLAAGTGRGWQITGRGRALFQKPVYREYGRR